MSPDRAKQFVCVLACVCGPALTSAPHGAFSQGPGADIPKREAKGPAPSVSIVQAPPRKLSGQERAAEERLERAAGFELQGKLAEAEKELLDADAKLPDYGPVLDRLTALQYRMKKTEKALETLERWIRRGKPFDDKAYLVAAQMFTDLKAFVPGEKDLIAWAADRRMTSNLHAAIGILRLGAFDYGEGEIELRKALEGDPANAPALKAMFRLYGRFQKYDKLQPFLDKGIETKPNSVPILMLSGASLLRLERLPEAKARFSKIVELEPKNAAAWVNLGSVFHGLGDKQEAKKSFQKAIDLDGKSLEAPINLATALEDEGKFAEARDLLLAARKRGIEDVDLLNALTVAHHLNKEYDAAIVLIKESLKRDPRQDAMKKLLERIEAEKAGRVAPPAAVPGAARATQGAQKPA